MQNVLLALWLISSLKQKCIILPGRVIYTVAIQMVICENDKLIHDNLRKHGAFATIATLWH